MIKLTGISSFSKAPKNAVVTLGVFDGCHTGHRAIFHQVLDAAKRENKLAGVVTFSSHPDLLTNKTTNSKKSTGLIFSLAQRHDCFSRLGFDFVIELPFDNHLMDVSAEKFIHEFLVEELSIHGLVLGHDAAFGKDRRGDFVLAKKLLAPHSVACVQVEPVISRDAPISSSRIRQNLKAGEIQRANRALGQCYEVRGTVIKGDGRGRTIGFPTINVEPQAPILLPHGVWSVQVRCDGGDQQDYPAIANIGTRPTFVDDKKAVLEVHILDFAGDLYDSCVDILFIKMIRSEQSFPSAEGLISQINEDISLVRQQQNTERQFLALGSNVGDRLDFIQKACVLLEKNAISIKAHSNFYETAPQGVTDQARFLNGVLEVCSALSPVDLLSCVKQIECEIGRLDRGSWQAREIDIDIVFYGAKMLCSKELSIPHPLMNEREFVLKPLADIAPLLRHPKFDKTVAELLEGLYENHHIDRRDTTVYTTTLC